MDFNQDIGSLTVDDSESLIDFAGTQKGIVLIFIPDTQGISSRIQLKNLRNDYHKISAKGFRILVITSETFDDLSSNTDDLSLPFMVKHDEDNIFAKNFNTLGTKFDNPYISERTKRRTYILNNKLETMHVIDNIHPEFHSEEIMNLLENKKQVELTSDGYLPKEGICSEK